MSKSKAMKPKTVVAFFIFFLSISVKSQSSIYVCVETGAVGYSFGGSTSGLDQVELDQIALERCREYGGVDCQYFGYIPSNGAYIAFMYNLVGVDFYGIVGRSFISSDAAIQKAYEEYQNSEYPDIDGAKILSWYIPE